jgi:hypothetical protein
MAFTQFRMTTPAPIVWVYAINPKPENVKLKKAPRYEVTFVLDRQHPDWAPLEKIMVEVCTAKFGSVAGRKFPAKDGTKEADDAQNFRRPDGSPAPKDREFARGKILVSTHALVVSSKRAPVPPPRLVVMMPDGSFKRFEAHERAAASQHFYAGVHAIGEFGITAYEGMGGGVSIYLNELLSLNYGDRISTGIDDEAKYGEMRRFAGHVGANTPYNPTLGATSIV